MTHLRCLPDLHHRQRPNSGLVCIKRAYAHKRCDGSIDGVVAWVTCYRGGSANLGYRSQRAHIGWRNRDTWHHQFDDTARRLHSSTACCYCTGGYALHSMYIHYGYLSLRVRLESYSGNNGGLEWRGVADRRLSVPTANIAWPLILLFLFVVVSSMPHILKG